MVEENAMIKLWQIGHYLFGWHYIEYRDSCTSFVARIKRCPNGLYRLTTATGVYDTFLNPDGTFMKSSGSWIPLTFKPGELQND